MGKFFLRHTIICFFVSFIIICYWDITKASNENITNITMISSFIILLAYNQNKFKIYSQKTNLSFLKENENKIIDNLKNNRSIDWGIEEEKNWRYKWNNLQPKNINSFHDKFIYYLFLLFKIFILACINSIYMSLLEGILLLIIKIIIYFI